MSKAVKGMMIEAIEKRLGETTDFVVVDSSKLEANADNALREELRGSGLQVMQVKNKLALLALKKRGIEGLEDVMSGPSCIVWGAGDIVELAKEIAKRDKAIEDLTVKGGAVDGQPLDADGVAAWSKAKGRLETIAEIAGAILSPGALVAGALLGPGGTLSGQLKAMGDKEGDDAPAEAA